MIGGKPGKCNIIGVIDVVLRKAPLRRFFYGDALTC